MKFRGMEIPPWKNKKTDEESGNPTQESFVRTEKPAPLDAEGIVIDLSVLSPGELVHRLDEYCQTWQNYASDRQYYSPNTEVPALWKARGRAIDIAQRIADVRTAHEIAKAKPSLESERVWAEQQAEITNLQGELKTVLDEMNGSLALSIEIATERNEEKIRDINGATNRENRETLAHSVTELEELTPKQSLAEGPKKAETPTLVETEQSGKEEGRVLSVKQEAARAAVAPERSEMDRTEKAYLDAYKEFYSKRGAKEKKEPKELKKLEFEYNKARIEYGNALVSNAEQRILAKRDGKPLTAEQSERENKLRTRYMRIVRFNEVIKPAAENKYRAKIEAIDSRERGVIMKGLVWAGKQNQKLESKYGKTTARIIRAVSTATIAGGLGVATGALASLGVASLAGYGVLRVGKSLLNTAVAAGAGEAMSKLVGKFAKKDQVDAQKSLAALTLVGRKAGQAISIDDLQAYDDERMYEQKYADERTVEQRKMHARILTAFLVGGALSFTEGLVLSHDASHEALSHVSGGAGHGDPASHGVGGGTKGVPIETKPGTGEVRAPAPQESGSGTVTEKAAAGVVVAKGIELPKMEPVTLAGNIHNADQLFGHFKEQLVKMGTQNPELLKAPSVKALLDHSNAVGHLNGQDVLTKWIGLQHNGSPIMHEGDSLSISKDGSILFKHANESGGHVIIDAQGQPVPQSELEKFLTFKEVTHAAPAHEAAPESPAEAAPADHAPGVPTDTDDAPLAPVQPDSPLLRHDDVPVDSISDSAVISSVVEHPIPHATVEHLTGDGVDVHPQHVEAPVSQVTEPQGPKLTERPELFTNHHGAEVPTAPNTLNSFNFDLAKPQVGLDSHGNLFAHIVKTGDLKLDKETAFATAHDFAKAHPNTTVFYTYETRTPIFGTLHKHVEALRFDPNASSDAVPYHGNGSESITVKSVPADTELRNPGEMPTAPVPVPEQIPAHEPVIPSGSKLEGILTNKFGIKINTSELHLYAVPDAQEPGKEALMVYGNVESAKGDIVTEVSRLAQEHPGRNIYFQAYVTTEDGSSHAYIARAMSDKSGAVGFSASPGDDGLMDVKINPEVFTRIVK